MKNTILFLLIFCSCLTLATAQDIITLRSGEEMKVRIIHLNPNDVTFIPENSSDTASILRDAITQLRYHNGINIYLSEKELNMPGTAFPENGNDSLYYLGARDARYYYKGYKAAATFTLVASVFMPWGLVPAFACSSTPPKMNTLGYKDPKLIANSNYYNGYTEQAYKIKKKKVWQGFAIGTGIFFGFVIISSVAAATAL